ncbi:hypothetical protein GCM10027057_07460 [Marisediminicola antarctica]|uniref:DUF5671 domain-containing protein n=1 Tax=Marisediminicola antarctica TaxID=674079 RepID=A0A7L5AKZ7_9MICO|nr:hypothetical protein BHD05_15195 [Marisediminicola antarctica]
MTAAVQGTPGIAGGAGRSVRRLIVFVLLFATVTIAAIGLGGLVGRVLDAGGELAVGDTAGLAQALAFTLIGGPLALVLWWFLWRGFTDPTERSSVAWGLYLAAMSTVSLITFSTSLLSTASAGVDGRWEPRAFASGLVWALVWLWHQWMRHHPTKGPTQLVDLAPVIGYLFGLILGVGGAVTAIGSVLDAAITGTGSAIAGSPWWQTTLQGVVWMAGGGAIWWWHWFRERTRLRRSGFAAVALVIVAALGAVILTLGGLGTTIFVLLELAVDRRDPVLSIVAPLAPAIASAAVGSLLWVYYRGIATRDAGQIGLATRLVTSGVGLAAAASGIGIIVNSLLAAIGSPLAESSARTLLLAGISSLAVGAPLWWVAWRPTAPVPADTIGSTGRRVYLIAVFGLSAVVALITLLVIGYRIFEFTLDGASGGSLLERVRAPLGLLSATALVAAYHFAVWRRDAARIAATPGRRPTIGRVVLVTGADPDPLVRAVQEASGAAVSVWRRAGAATIAPSADQVATALDGVSGARVLIVTGPGDLIEVIPLAD